MIQVDRWSWHDVARSLNAAGIIYKDSAGWDAWLLTRKVATVRVKQRRRDRVAAARYSVPPAALREAVANLGTVHTSIGKLVMNVQNTVQAPAAPVTAARQQGITEGRTLPSVVQSPALAPPEPRPVPIASRGLSNRSLPSEQGQPGVSHARLPPQPAPAFDPTEGSNDPLPLPEFGTTRVRN